MTAPPAGSSHSRAGSRAASAIYLAFFASGAAGLILQVVWLRMLKLVFGSTVPAVSTVLSAFMAGLALGSFVIGRIADRQPNKIRLYGLLELGVGGSALLLPALFTAIKPLCAELYRWQAVSGHDSLVGLANFALCFAILLVPTTLMGGTLPALCSYLIEGRSTLGKRVGVLYGLNTLGAVAGSFGAGFILIHLVGESNTMYMAAAVYILIGLLFLGRSFARVDHGADAAHGGGPRASAEEAASGDGLSPRHVTLVIVAFGLSGMTALGYEVAWTRCLMPFVGMDTYAFSAMLTVFLGGLALGSFLYTKLWDAASGMLRRLALLQIGIGLTALLSLVVFSQLRHLNDLLFQAAAIQQSWLGTTSVKFLDAAAAVLVPTLLMGATFPLVSKVVTSLKRKGRSIGNIYSANTVGAILGSFMAGFALIPLLGVQLAICVLAAVNILVGAVLWAVWGGRLTRLSLTAAVAIVGTWLGVSWLAAGTPMIQWTSYFHDEDKGFEILYAEEGVAASVAVLEREDGTREINLDGRSTAYTNYSDLQVHCYLGHLPLMLRQSRQPATVLVVGFGLGSTAWSCLQHQVESVDCVELVKEERQTAAYFADHNHDVLSHPRFNWLTGDGRNHLSATERTYDVISVNAVHPRVSPSLYTSDFYEQVRRRLSSDGVACVWLTLHGLSSDEFRMLLRAFAEVLPEAMLFDVNSQHMVVVGSKKPIKIDHRQWLERLRGDAVRRHLAQVHLDHPHAMLSHFVLGPESLREYIGEVPLNSDDRPYVEFGREATYHDKTQIFNELMDRRESVLPWLASTPAASDAGSALADDATRYYHAMEHGIIGRYYLSVALDRARAEPYIQRAMVMWPDNEGLAHLLGKCSHIATSSRAAAFQRHWAAGWRHEQDGRPRESLEAYGRSIAANPEFPQAHKSLARVADQLGQYELAIAAVGRLRALQDRREYAQWQLALTIQREFANGNEQTVSMPVDGNTVRFARGDFRTDVFLAKAYNQMGLIDRAEDVLSSSAARNPAIALVHVIRGENLLDGGRFGEAVRHFEHALRVDPGQKQAVEQLEQVRKRLGRIRVEL